MSTIGYYICVPFAWLVRLFYDLTNSYGVALILFTLVIKLIMLPFQMKSKKSMMRMSRVSGQMLSLIHISICLTVPAFHSPPGFSGWRYSTGSDTRSVGDRGGRTPQRDVYKRQHQTFVGQHPVEVSDPLLQLLVLALQLLPVQALQCFQAHRCV